MRRAAPSAHGTHTLPRGPRHAVCARRDNTALPRMATTASTAGPSRPPESMPTSYSVVDSFARMRPTPPCHHCLMPHSSSHRLPSHLPAQPRHLTQMYLHLDASASHSLAAPTAGSSKVCVFSLIMFLSASSGSERALLDHELSVNPADCMRALPPPCSPYVSQAMCIRHTCPGLVGSCERCWTADAAAS